MGHPIPAPDGVRIYGVPRPDGGGTTDELFSLEEAGGMMASDIRSEVFVAPEGGVYRITGLKEEVHFSLPIHDDFVLAPVRIMVMVPLILTWMSADNFELSRIVDYFSLYIVLLTAMASESSCTSVIL